MGLLVVTRIVFLKVHSSWQYRKWYLHLRQTFAKEKGSTNYQWSTETVTSSLAHIFHQGSVHSHACVKFTVYRDSLIMGHTIKSPNGRNDIGSFSHFMRQCRVISFVQPSWCSLIFIVCGSKCIEKMVDLWPCFLFFYHKSPEGLRVCLSKLSTN